jgi:hypothetical protein
MKLKRKKQSKKNPKQRRINKKKDIIEFFSPLSFIKII